MKRKVLVADVFHDERSKDFRVYFGWIIPEPDVNPWNMIESTWTLHRLNMDLRFHSDVSCLQAHTAWEPD